MTGLRTALSFLTVLPVGPRAMGDMASSRAWFPLVGLALGGLLAGLDLLLRSVFSPEVLAALLVVTLVLLTRALHLEGLADLCDGLFGGYTPERRLEIMKDPHMGVFAGIGLVCIVLLKWSAIAALPPTGRAAALVLFPCLSRWGMLAAMASFPYARTHGTGAAFQGGRTAVALLGGGATAAIAAVLLLGWAGVLAFAAVTAAALALARLVASMLGGGLTGDAYGAINEVAEVVGLLCLVALMHGVPELFSGPSGQVT